ncbi:MAG: 5-aminolevulinate synthase [Jannaschia sp.]
MSQTLPPAAIVVLLMLTGGGYALATVGLKLASGAVTVVSVALILTGLAAAVLSEVALLRVADLPVVYLAIVVFETLLVLGYAATVGGALTPMQVVGAVFVLGGFGLVTMQV